MDGSSLTSPAISWKLQLRLGTSFPRAMFIFSETNSHPTSPPQPMACQPVMASRQQNPGHKTNGSHFYPRLLSIARNWLRIGPCCRSSAAPGGLFCKRHETPPSCHSLGPSIETTAFYGQHTMQFLPMFQVDSKVQTHTFSIHQDSSPTIPSWSSMIIYDNLWSSIQLTPIHPSHPQPSPKRIQLPRHIFSSAQRVSCSRRPASLNKSAWSRRERSGDGW